VNDECAAVFNYKLKEQHDKNNSHDLVKRHGPWRVEAG